MTKKPTDDDDALDHYQAHGTLAATDVAKVG